MEELRRYKREADEDEEDKSEGKVDLEQIVEKEINEDMASDNVDKRDAAAEASRLDHVHHVLPPPHDIPPHSELPLFPPLGTAPPHHPHPTPVPATHHHVTISTPTHHVSHGVADHGTHHAVHKEHHQVHGHGHHVAPLVHHMVDHHAAGLHHPHQPAAVPVVMLPPVAPKHYDHPVSGYPKPAHGGSLEEIFGLHKPAYQAPTPAYHAPAPAYHAPAPAYHEPKPVYHEPAPAYVEPKPVYHEPKPAYHEPAPVYKPAGPYVPDYKHPSGDYVSPHAKMAGHPFSLEAVFNLDMPLYYMQKYPHMAHLMHHGHHEVHHPAHHEVHHPVHHDIHPVHHAVHPVHHEVHPVHHEVHHPAPAYKNPASGYAKPAHGASLEEIFGIHTAYHPAPKQAYHEPKPAYHEPAPVYHEPAPVYHEPKPAYHEPAPVYHEPKPKYGHGSLEAVFGLAPSSYVTPVPHYDVPTTYKPKMPDYLHQHPHAKSLPAPHDPGYVLHYLPYENYQPHHPETLAHPPPVPHHPHAAHMLVPGTHVPPPAHHLDIAPGFVTPTHHAPHHAPHHVPHHEPHHAPLLGVTPAPHHTPLLGVTPAPAPAPVPLLGVTPTPLLGVTPDHDTPILHPHSILEDTPVLHPDTLQAIPAVPLPQPDFLPHAGARKKRSSEQTGQSLSNLLTDNSLHKNLSYPDNHKTTFFISDMDKHDLESLLGLYKSSDLQLIHLCSHEDNQNTLCNITEGDIGNRKHSLPLSSPFSLPINNFSPIDNNHLPLKSEGDQATEKLLQSTTVTIRPSELIASRVLSTSLRVEEPSTTTSSPSSVTTPGSFTSTPTWSFPNEGSKKQPKQFFSQTDQTSSVYFDPSLRNDFRLVSSQSKCVFNAL